MDGFKLIQEFQGSGHDMQIPFVVMTDNLELAKESIRLGAYQFILKPITDKGMIKAKISGAIKNAEVLHQVALNYMEYVPGGVILINAMTGKILYVNARALDIFECESTEQFRDFVGANFRNAILPEDYAKVGEELKEQFQKDSGLTKQISTARELARETSSAYTMWAASTRIRPMVTYSRRLSRKTISR
jgi:CheY-like chemotaxis protein